MLSTRQIQINALVQNLRYLLGEIAGIVAQLRGLGFPITPPPKRGTRPAACEEHNDLYVTRFYGERGIATGYNTSQPDEANVVLAKRTIAWADINVPGFDVGGAMPEGDDIPYAVAVAFSQKKFQAVSKSDRSRLKKAYEAGEIFFEGCTLGDVTYDWVMQMIAWLQGEPAIRPNGKSLPAPPVKKPNAFGEAADKANLLIKALNYFGARKANHWSVGFTIRRTHAVNMEYHVRSGLARILFVLLTNYRCGLKERGPNADPSMRICPWTGERFKHEPVFNCEREDSRHARRMLGRLIQLRYHGASRSIDSLKVGWSESADGGHLDVATVSKTNLLDRARAWINRLGSVIRSDQKHAADALLPGKAASIVTSWFRHDAKLIAAAKKGKDNDKQVVYVIRTFEGTAYSSYQKKLWKEAQITAGVPLRKFHSLKKSAVTDLYLGGHSLQDISEYIGTTEKTLEKNYRLKDQKRVYRGPAYENGPGVPPAFRAEKRREAREQGLPYPF